MNEQQTLVLEGEIDGLSAEIANLRKKHACQIAKTVR
jgi:hypothetical protein